MQEKIPCYVCYLARATCLGGIWIGRPSAARTVLLKLSLSVGCVCIVSIISSDVSSLPRAREHSVIRFVAHGKHSTRISGYFSLAYDSVKPTNATSGKVRLDLAQRCKSSSFCFPWCCKRPPHLSSRQHEPVQRCGPVHRSHRCPADLFPSSKSISCPRRSSRLTTARPVSGKSVSLKQVMNKETFISFFSF